MYFRRTLIHEYQLEILLSLFSCFYLLLYLKDSKEKKVIEAVTEASIRFATWREDHPYVYIGLSDEGKKLLAKLIICHDNFHELLTFVDGSDHRAYLMSLFDELPPLPNKPTPKTFSKPSLVRVLLYM